MKLTLQLLLQDSGVFEMMTLAADLGVEDLRAACEDHVTSTLSVESACTLLAAAMEIQDRPGNTCFLILDVSAAAMVV